MFILLRLPLLLLLLGCSFLNYAAPEDNAVKAIRIGIPEQAGLIESQGPKANSVMGFVTEFWQIWGLDQKRPIEFIYLTPQKLLQALKHNHIDVIGLSFTSQANKDITYSIPYLKYKQQLFHRINTNPQDGIQVGIHAANFKTLDFLPQNISRAYFFTVQDMLTQQDRFDVLYSSQPWRLIEELKQLKIQDQFHRNGGDNSEIFFHFATRKNDKALGLLLDDSLRAISKNQALAWQRKFFSAIHGEQHFSITLGEYLTDITLTEKNYILEHQAIQYPVTSHETPPYIINRHFSNMTESGFSIDMAKEITQRTGLLFKAFHTDDVKDISNKNIDILLKIPVLTTPLTGYSFSTPYTEVNYGVLTRNNMQKGYRFKDLKQKKVGAIKSSHAAVLLQTKLPNTKLSFYHSLEAATEALSLKKVDYVVADKIALSYTVKDKELTHIVTPLSPEEYDKIQLSFAAYAQSDTLIDLINKSLQNLTTKGLSDLYNKWSKVSTSAEQQTKSIEKTSTIPTYLIIGIPIVLLVMLWLLYRQYHYRTMHHKAIEKALSLAESDKLEAEKSAQAKISFLARMSHEIRTPMNGVLGMAEALAYTELNNNQKDLLENLNSSASNLLALLDDVLDFSKMDAGKLTLELVPVALPTLFTRVTNSFKHVENEKPINIVLNIESNVHDSYFIDPTRITQVLNNLISNAIKFTHKGSITISLKLLERDQKGEVIYDTLSISVKDTGIGIAKENQGSLFTPFIQADDDITRKFGGTGLGLSICHEIVSAMGSVITLDSTLNQGCDFSFHLKLKHAHDNNKKEERRKNLRVLNATNDNRFEHLRVLIAEDNLINIQVLSAQLKRLNIDADIAYDGAQALEMHNHKPYDIIISDCHMPKMDGFELAQKVSQAKNQVSVWLIAITADALKGAASKCKKAGFNDYMAKPCPQEQVTNKLNHAYRQLIIKREANLIEKLKEAPYVFFDPHALFLLHDNDIVLSRNLAEVFIKTWQEEKEHFLAELAQHNFSQLYALAHKQKSVIRYLCSGDLESAIINLEKHAQNKNIAKTQKSCLLLIKQFDILHTEINHWLTTLSQHNRFFRL